jgi:hypothetical protein
MIRNRNATVQVAAEARPKRAVTRDEMQRLFGEELGIRAV